MNEYAEAGRERGDANDGAEGAVDGYPHFRRIQTHFQIAVDEQRGSPLSASSGKSEFISINSGVGSVGREIGSRLLDQGSVISCITND